MSGRSERKLDRETRPMPADGSTLLLAPSIGGAERNACVDLLADHDFGRSRVIHVLYMESAAERYRVIERNCCNHPRESAVITIGSSGLSERGPEPSGPYFVESLPDPADLTGLGMALDQCLSEWDEDGTDLVLCFDSLTILLQYAEFERVYRFLHTLSGKLSDAQATAHFHLDPAAHAESEIARLTPIFDHVLEIDGDGQRTTSR